jgi:ribosome-binding protein aMBF1 (putative translation factor)
VSRYADADLLTAEQADALAGQVRRARGERGWSQARLSRESGVPQSVIAHLEGRYCRPTTVRAGKLAAALGITLAGLTGAGDGT